jgi:hypothetical protein
VEEQKVGSARLYGTEGSVSVSRQMNGEGNGGERNEPARKSKKKAALNGEEKQEKSSFERE